MKPLSDLLLSLVALVLASAACVPRSSGVSSTSAEDPAGTGGGEPAALRSEPRETSPVLAAFDADGALVVLDPTDGALVDRRELAHFGEPADLLLDAQRARFLIALESEGGEGDAAIVEVPFDGESLGAPNKLAGTLGHARLASHPEGVVVASNGDGPRVRLLRHDGVPSAGRALDPVRTWWTDGSRIEGLALGRGSPAVRFSLQVDASGGIEVAERRAIGITPEEATLLVTEAGEEIVVARGMDGAVDLSRLDPGSGKAGEPKRRLRARAGRLDAAVLWPAGHVALATAKPPALLLASIEGEAEVSLPLEASTPSGAYGRRSLVVVGDRLFVATKEGVLAFRSEADEAKGVASAEGFDGTGLRGPLAAAPGLP